MSWGIGTGPWSIEGVSLSPGHPAVLSVPAQGPLADAGSLLAFLGLCMGKQWLSTQEFV